MSYDVHVLSAATSQLAQPPYTQPWRTRQHIFNATSNIDVAYNTLDQLHTTLIRYNADIQLTLQVSTVQHQTVQLDEDTDSWYWDGQPSSKKARSNRRRRAGRLR